MKVKKAGILTKLIIITIMVYAVVTLVTLNSKIAAAEAQKQQLQREAAEVAARNEELKYCIEHSGDAETIQKIAREKLGLVMPGEIIFFGTKN